MSTKVALLINMGEDTYFHEPDDRMNTLGSCMSATRYFECELNQVCKRAAALEGTVERWQIVDDQPAQLLDVNPTTHVSYCGDKAQVLGWLQLQFQMEGGFNSVMSAWHPKVLRLAFECLYGFVPRTVPDEYLLRSMQVHLQLFRKYYDFSEGTWRRVGDWSTWERTFMYVFSGTSPQDVLERYAEVAQEIEEKRFWKTCDSTLLHPFLEELYFMIFERDLPQDMTAYQVHDALTKKVLSEVSSNCARSKATTKRFGERIKLLREQREYSLEQTASHLRFTVSRLYSLEMGTTDPSLDELLAISRYWQTSIDLLLSE